MASTPHLGPFSRRRRAPRPLPPALLACALLLTAAPPAGSQMGATGGAGSSFSVLSPYRTLAKSKQVLDAGVRRVALDLGYSEEGAGARGRQLANLPGVQAARFLAKPIDAGWIRVLELALSDYPAGGFQIEVWGVETDGSGQRANPDVAAAESAFGNLLSQLQSSAGMAGAAKFGDPDNRYVSYKLSYVQSDRACALLKVLGYSVIEFQAGAGQPVVYDQVFSAAPGGAPPELPVVVRLIDSAKTSLLEPVTGPQARPAPMAGGRGVDANLNLGGLFLDRITSGVPQQRLLIVYDSADPEPMQVLVNLLRNEIDIPAQQILIEALVIEIDRDKLKDVGIDFSGQKDGSSFSFSTDSQGFVEPFTYAFTRPSLRTLFEFDVSLKALVSSGHGKVLSRPSVLVLDGRQARIQVGEKIPFTSNISATNTGTLSSTDYLTTGIVLNLRPRVSEDGTQITMQVETLISSPGATSFVAESGVLVAPPILSREVQTLVRVANNTPFIIGGLIATSEQTDVSGVPGLSKIPGLGALFRKKTRNDSKQEVIVVITPHVVPHDTNVFTYGIPKDSEIFDSFDKEMFRNVYRIRTTDIFDLGFVYESPVLQDLYRQARQAAEADPVLANREPVRSLLAGGIPGEEALVRRMLAEVIRKRGFGRFVDPEKIIFFLESDDGGLDVQRLADYRKQTRERGMNAMTLSFERSGVATLEQPFDPPRATVDYAEIGDDEIVARLREGNVRGPDGRYVKNTVVLTEDFHDSGGSGSIERLRDALVLKLMLILNSQLEMTLDGFHVGVELIFPNEEALRDRSHLVDRKAAELFYEVSDYYYAFEQEFARATREIQNQLRGGAAPAAAGSSAALPPAAAAAGNVAAGPRPEAPDDGAVAAVADGRRDPGEEPAAPAPAAGHSVVSADAAPCLAVRARPEAGAERLQCLAPGTRVRLSGGEGDWARVALSGGGEGWLARAYVTAGSTG